MKLYIFFVDEVKFLTNKKFTQNFTDIFNIIIGIIKVVTPGQNIFIVFKTLYFTLISIIAISFQCLYSAFWGFYRFKDSGIGYY